MPNDGLFGFPAGHPGAVTRVYEHIGDYNAASSDNTAGTTLGGSMFPLEIPTGPFSMMRALLIAGGGGGGSGRKGGAGETRTGGSGAGGGAMLVIETPIELLPGGLWVMVGAGGAGGPGQTNSDSLGKGGGTGGPTVIGSQPVFSPNATTYPVVAYAASGTAGLGGRTNQVDGSSGGLASASTFAAWSGGDGGNALVNGSGGSAVDVPNLTTFHIRGCPGGGGGGGISSGNADGNGGAGGDAWGNGGGAGGTATAGAGNPGSPGTASDWKWTPGSGGGGGAGGDNTAGGDGGAGGAGALYGAGGGGGGGARNTSTTSGTGGNGAHGLAVITFY